MHIAHLTLLHGYNYGGMLQAFATQKILKSYGHKVTTVDYHPFRRARLIRKLTFNISPIHKKLQQWQDTRNFSCVSEFTKFRADNFEFSPSCNTSADLTHACREIDAVVVGSDQVWSSVWLHPPYFIDFKLPDKCKRVSLSACCGQLSKEPAYLDFVKINISRFDSISVRNNFTAELIKQTTGRDAEILCDPTLATDIPTEKVDIPSKPYIIAYVINRPASLKTANQIIHDLKAKTKLDVYSITPAELKGSEKLDVDKIYNDINPFQWNYLISNAAAVVTDSFHGSIFSIKNHKKLYLIENNLKASKRISALLQSFSMTDVVVNENNKIDDIDIFHKSICWENVDATIEEMREQYNRFVSKSFLEG